MPKRTSQDSTKSAKQTSASIRTLFETWQCYAMRNEEQEETVRKLESETAVRFLVLN